MKVEMTAEERGLVIKNKLKDKCMEQQYLAMELGITPKKLSEYLTGKIKTTPPEVLNRICRILDLNPDKDFVVWRLDNLTFEEGNSLYVRQFLEVLQFVKDHRNDPWLEHDKDPEYSEKVRYDLEHLFDKYLHAKDQDYMKRE